MDHFYTLRNCGELKN